MTEHAPNFVTQTHEGRAGVVAANATTIERLYPESQFFIYDGGLSAASRDRLASFDSTTVVDWRREADYAAQEGELAARLAELEAKVRDNTYLAHLYKEVLGLDFTYSEVERWNFYMRQKPRSILDLTDRVAGNIVWLDDDAVVANRFDEVFDLEFDIGVTVRSEYDQRKEQLSALNAGVIFFDTSADAIAAFVRTWLETIDGMALTKHREQDALSKLVRQEDPGLYDEYYAASDISVDGTDLTVRTFPCLRYNFRNFKGGIDPDVNKIFHFHGSSTLTNDYNRELIADIRDDRLSNWYRATATEGSTVERVEPPVAE